MPRRCLTPYFPHDNRQDTSAVVASFVFMKDCDNRVFPLFVDFSRHPNINNDVVISIYDTAEVEFQQTGWQAVWPSLFPVRHGTTVWATDGSSLSECLRGRGGTASMTRGSATNVQRST